MDTTDIFLVDELTYNSDLMKLQSIIKQEYDLFRSSINNKKV